MNRRDILTAALAAPILAMPLPALAASPRITWLPGTLKSPYAALAAHHIHQLMADRIIYTTAESAAFGYSYDLTDPTFVVADSDIMFYPTRGFRREPSLIISIREKGVLIGRSRMLCNGDYEAYHGRHRPPTVPLHGFRAVHTPYEPYPVQTIRVHDEAWQVIEHRPDFDRQTFPALEEALGRENVGLDIRFLKGLKR